MSTYEQAIKIAADSISQLRVNDVYRVLEWNPQVAGLAKWIKANRPDLASEVDAVIEELATI